MYVGHLDRAEPLANPARTMGGTFMGTLRLPLAGAVILALLGCLGGAVLAQEEPIAEEEPAAQEEPIAQDEGSDLTAIVTGSVVSSSVDQSELELTEDGGVMRVGGLKARSEFEWSDPRLPSQGELTGNGTAYADVGIAYRYLWMLEGPEGYWTGPESGFCDAADRCRGTAILTGHGIHEGLFAVLVSGPQLDSSGDVLRDSVGNTRPVFDGAIFFGDPPPMPEPPEPPAE